MVKIGNNDDDDDDSSNNEEAIITPLSQSSDSGHAYRYAV